MGGKVAGFAGKSMQDLTLTQVFCLTAKAHLR
jgi:hypothetical protein